MDFLSALNLEQLGTAGILVAYQFWQNIQLRRERDAVIEERKYWQQVSFDSQREGQQELFAAVRTFEKVAEAMKG